MPRNGAGVFNLAQPAFQSQTPISSSAVNSDLSDIADGLTGSLPRDGQGAMTAVLPLAATGFNYAADPNTGMSRSASDEQIITCGGTVIARFSTTGVDFTGAVTQNGIVILPPGFEGFTAASTAPAGWLLRDGAAVSRTTYAALFIAIGTTYGSGDGSTTFNVPDARGRVDAGIDSGTNRIPGYVLGTAGGSASQTVFQNRLPNVVLSVSASGSAAVVSNETNVGIGLGGGGGAFSTGGGVTNFSAFLPGAIYAQITSTGSANVTGASSSLNGGVAQQPLPTVQPTIASTPIIKT